MTRLPFLVRTFAPFLVLCLLPFCSETFGQDDITPKGKAPAQPTDARSTSQSALSPREKRIAELAVRIAATDLEREADALLVSDPDIAKAELVQALHLETLRLRNTPIAREKILQASFRVLRYTEGPGMAFGRGMAERGLGIAYANLENWPLAEKHLLTAVSLFSRMGAAGRPGLISSSRDLAAIYLRKGDTRRSREYYEKAGRLARDAGDRESAIYADNGLAMVHFQLRDHATAYSYLENSLSLSEALADKGPKLATLAQIASAYQNQGRLGKAVEAQEHAYRTAVESGSPARLNYLFQTAVLYIKLGDLPAAYSRFRKVLAEAEKTGDQTLYFYSLLNVAQVNERYGRDKKAFELYSRVIDLADAGLKERTSLLRRSYVTGKAEAVARLAEMHVDRGEIKAAIDLHKQNLEMLRSAQADIGPDARDRSKDAYAAVEVSVLTSLGDLYSLRGERTDADAHFSSAQAIAQKFGFESGSIDSLLSMASHAARNEEHAVAASYLGRAELSIGRHGRLDQLLKLRTTEAEILRSQGRLATADLKFQEALRISESLRTDVVMPDQRASYFAGLFRPFDHYIDFLMERHTKQSDAGFDRRAFDVSERRRARALLDSLRVARTDIRVGVEPALLEEEARIRSQLNSAAREHFGGIDPPLLRPEVVGDPIEVSVGSPKADISYLAAELARIETAIRKRSPRYAELMQPRPLRSHAVQSLLGEDTILLNYTLGEKKSYLWVISNRAVTSFVLPPRDKIEDLVRKAYSDVSDRSIAEEKNDASMSEAEALTRILLGPAADLIGNRRIVVVADGALQYLPFSSLPDPRSTTGAGSLMLLSNEIQFAPSASVVSVLRQDLKDRPRASRSVAIFADPVFSDDDERLSGRKDPRPVSVRSEEESITRDLFLPEIDDEGNSNATRSIARLPFSRREADDIFENSPAASSIKAVDFEASRKKLAGIDLSSYRIVHFATHGILNSEQPELSGIVLSLVNEKGEPVNGFLRLNEIYNMRLNADLVVLSACQTALGKEVRGEGLIGLTRGFMYAGSPRVLASLWKVDDVATAELMKIFYAKMLKENQHPAAALRTAKIEMMKQKRWRSPYYWAAFEIQGEWP